MNNQLNIKIFPMQTHLLKTQKAETVKCQFHTAKV